MSDYKFPIGSRVFERISGIDGTVDRITLQFGCEPEYRILRFGVDNNGELWTPVHFTESRLDAV